MTGMSRRIAPIPATGMEALAILHRACFPDDPWEAPALARILALSGGFGWLAFENEEPAGFILVRDLGNECEVLSLGVAPRWRRRRIAQELLRTAINEAERRELPSWCWKSRWTTLRRRTSTVLPVLSRWAGEPATTAVPTAESMP
jgi:ribosomal protein S18 acetylase RimI-like enzyme